MNIGLWRFSVIALSICVLVQICGADSKPASIDRFDPESYVPGELIIRFTPEPDGRTESRSVRQSRLRNTISGVEITRDLRAAPGMSLLELPANISVEKAISQLTTRRDVLYVEPNFKLQALATIPNDPCFGLLWGLYNTGQTVNGVTGTADCDIDAPEAWDIVTDACDIIVAVIDSGVEYTHPDLAANIWINEAEYNGDPNVDDDDNGYTDDIYGYDFYNDDTNPMDDNFHGTHVAGTIGAVGNNNTGVCGVCWDVKIMALKFLNAYGGGNTADAVEAIRYAVDNGADVLNNSWGGGAYSQALEEAIEYAEEAGVIFVAAAGNFGTNNDVAPVYPTSYDCDNIISVMATDQNDRKAGFSCYGQTSVDLGAPGVNIFSTFPTTWTPGMQDYLFWTGITLSTDYEFLDGTSMAAPHVSGACALLWAANPDWPWTRVREAVINTVDLPYPRLNCVSGGRLNLNAAMDYKPPLMSISVGDSVGPDSGIDPNDPCYCECVEPGDLITYTIKYAPDDCNYYDVEVVDYMPLQTNFEPPAEPNDGIYSIFNHSYTWLEGTVFGHDPCDPCDPNITLQITVRVNELAEPLGTIVNRVTIESFGEPESFTIATETTDVCCWNGDIIYVNANASWQSYETGTSWAHAYRNLHDALNRVDRGCGNEIWVAAGTYSPGTNSDDVFDLPDGVSIYGGFVGNETSRSQRDFLANPTYLNGKEVCVRVINIENADSTITVDSVIIGKALSSGLYCEDSLLTLANCIIAQNGTDAIDVRNSTVTLQNCVIANNDDDGVYCYGTSSAPQITNCNIYNNGGHGINAYRAYPTVKNCFIHNNGDNGIYLNTPSNSATIRNVTIANNDAEAIALSSGTAPTVSNCILWHNNEANSFAELTGCSASYSCITDPLDPNGIDYDPTPDPNGHNIQCSPLFVTADLSVGNFHLQPDSPCRDMGDPCESYTNELDIDGESRLVNSIADMGADEYSCSDIVHDGDNTGDGRINLAEFYQLAPLWQMSSGDCDPNDPNTPTWNSDYDFDSDDDVDIVDLCSFSVDWAWQACYHDSPSWYFMTLPATLPDASEGGGALSAAMIENYRRAVWQAQAPEYTPTLTERIWHLENLIYWLEGIWLNTPGIQEEVDEEGFFNMLYQLQDELELLYLQYP